MQRFNGAAARTRRAPQVVGEGRLAPDGTRALYVGVDGARPPRSFGGRLLSPFPCLCVQQGNTYKQSLGSDGGVVQQVTRDGPVQADRRFFLGGRECIVATLDAAASSFGESNVESRAENSILPRWSRFDPTPVDVGNVGQTFRDCNQLWLKQANSGSSSANLRRTWPIVDVLAMFVNSAETISADVITSPPIKISVLGPTYVGPPDI